MHSVWMQPDAFLRALKVLVVDTDQVVLASHVDLLSDAGHHVRAASTFEAATRLVGTEAPDLIIADIRLGAYNGLHLLARSRSSLPDVSAIITYARADAVLRVEATRHGAIFLIKPVERAALLQAVDTIRRGQGPRPWSGWRRWPRKRISDQVQAHVSALPATVVDVSYGGLCFQTVGKLDADAHGTVGVDIPEHGLSLKGEIVWTSRSDRTSESYGGVALLESESDAVLSWRTFVDRVH